jgi:hypothetical protein
VVPAFHKGCADRLAQLQMASARVRALTRKEWPKGTALTRAQLVLVNAGRSGGITESCRDCDGRNCPIDGKPRWVR